MNAKGVDAVRAAIIGAEPFKPSHEQKKQPPAESERSRSSSAASLLMDIARWGEIYRSPENETYVDVEQDGVRRTLKLHEPAFRQYLIYEHYQASGFVPSKDAIAAALEGLTATAAFEGKVREVFKRVGEHEDRAGRRRLYLDLGGADWRAVEIDAEGWRIVDRPPVRFWRASGVQPLPAPEAGGGLDELKPFLNVSSERDFVIAVSWLLTALGPRGRYPMLVVTGEHGSAKSTTARLLRALIDPNFSDLRALPRDEHNLFLSATNAHALCFDNVSGALPAATSDALCRVSTGGGYATRALYSNSEETLYKVACPIILNGIDDMVTKPDLASRAVMLRLAAIPDEGRRTEEDLWRTFEEARARILGALLDGVARGLARHGEIRLKKPPRMADYARWATACETAYWREGAFLEAYELNRAQTIDEAIDADPVSTAMLRFLPEGGAWSGTATDLLAALEDAAGPDAVRTKGWPGNARALSSRIKRATPFLRAVGVEIGERREGKNRTRIVDLRRFPFCSSSSTPKEEKFASAASARAKDTGSKDAKLNKNNEIRRGGAADANADAMADANEFGGLRPPVADASGEADATNAAAMGACDRLNPLKNSAGGRTDAADANLKTVGGAARAVSGAGSPVERLVLTALAQARGSATIARLAELTGLSDAELRVTLQRLEAAGVTATDRSGLVSRVAAA